jgi:hypothetical protein
VGGTAFAKWRGCQQNQEEQRKWLVPVKDRPGGDRNSGIESPSLKDGQETRIVSIPIGSGPDVEDDDDDDPVAPQDSVVERWLNGSARART